MLPTRRDIPEEGPRPWPWPPPRDRAGLTENDGFEAVGPCTRDLALSIFRPARARVTDSTVRGPAGTEGVQRPRGAPARQQLSEIISPGLSWPAQKSKTGNVFQFRIVEIFWRHGREEHAGHDGKTARRDSGSLF